MENIINKKTLDIFDFEVQAVPLYIKGKQLDIENGAFEMLEKGKAISRTDNNSVLGIVSNGYHTIQNKEVLRMVTPLVERGDLELTGCGYFKNGAESYAQFALKGDMPVDILPNDPVLRRITLTWGHDGKLAVKQFMTVIRIVCQNTFERAMGENGNKGMIFRHSEQGRQEILELGDLQSNMDATFSKQIDLYRSMADKPMSFEEVRRYFAAVLGIKPEVKDNMQLENLIRVNYSHPTQQGISNTLYGAYNAVTYALSNASLGGKRLSEIGRTRSNLFGQAAVINHKAHNLARMVMTTSYFDQPVAPSALN